MAEEKKNADSKEQLDKALTEIDVIPDEDQEIVRIDSKLFKFSDVEFKLIEDHQEAFDLEMMKTRYTDYLLKYDYIVGDISYEKLRLRGFYEDYRKGIPIDMKISNLEDYLVEYCSFGCQYFVFERVNKVKSDPESYFKKEKVNVLIKVSDQTDERIIEVLNVRINKNIKRKLKINENQKKLHIKI